MRITDEEDRLIDMLLAQELGGERPADVTARVLARARTPERRIVRMGARLLAAAVVVLAALVGYMAMVGGDRPGTEAEPGGVARGATVVAGDEAKELELCGYCRIVLAPGGALREEGAEGSEAIFLERGKVVCKVDRAVGTFRVRTGLGQVHVTGTEFSVELVEEEGEEMKMLVKVLLGSVLVLSLSGQEYALSAEGDDEVAVGREVERDVVLEQLPRIVRAAALRVVEGMVLKEAEKITRVGIVFYEIDGVAGGKEYEIVVLSTGRLLSVEMAEDDDEDEDADDEDDDAEDEDGEDDDGDADDDDDEDEDEDDAHDDDHDDDDDDDDRNIGNRANDLAF